MSRIFLIFLCFPFLGSAQEAGFYVNTRYQKHFEEGRKTGRSELAFFALEISQKDSCWQVRQYRGINDSLKIHPNFYKDQLYCWDDQLQLWSADCTRAPSGGLFRHQHSEGQDWIKADSTNQEVQLRRCGWARSINVFVKGDSSLYLQKQ